MHDTGTAAATAKETTETTSMVRQIAHELRQPLSTMESIAYYLDLILPRDDEKARTQVERLRQLVDQSNWIVSNAVHYVQAAPPSPRGVPVLDLAAAAADEVKLQHLCFVNVEPTTLVRMDPSQAEHLFHSLFAFFRKFVTPERPLRLSVDPGRSLTRVRFHTLAAPFSSYELQCMFDPFGPGHVNGSGLGLASVKSIVEAHEGILELHASREAGTSVVIVLSS